MTTDTGVSDISSNPLSSRPCVTLWELSPMYVAYPRLETLMTSFEVALINVKLAPSRDVILISVSCEYAESPGNENTKRVPSLPAEKIYIKIY